MGILPACTSMHEVCAFTFTFPAFCETLKLWARIGQQKQKKEKDKLDFFKTKT